MKTRISPSRRPLQGRSPVAALGILICGLTITGEFLETGAVNAAPLDHYTLSTMGAAQAAWAPFSAWVTANDNTGNVVSNYSGDITISAEILSVPPLVISEVD